MRQLNRQLFRLVAAVGLASMMVSCATARIVSVEPGEGGQIAVSPQGSEEARQKAELIMAQNCGPRRYKIVREGEEVVGRTAQARTSAQKDIWGRPTLSTASTTSDVTEWRITYKCLSQR